MTPTEPLGRTLDLSDPETLCLVLEDLAGGMRQQTTASQSGSAMGGHPNPAFLYARTEEVLRAAKAKIVELAGLAPKPAAVQATPAAREQTVAPAPAAAGDAVTTKKR